MSILTQRLLANIDFVTVKKSRRKNALYLHSKLSSLNKLNIEPKANSSLMVYPLLIDGANIRDYLISKKIFIALYWPNVLEWCDDEELEYYLSKNILPLPIDQRYTLEDMRYIAKMVKEGVA